MADLTPVNHNNGGSGDRTMKNLSDQINQAHTQRMREIADFIVNKVQFLPEEIEELRNIMNEIVDDSCNQRNDCMRNFGRIEKLIDLKISEASNTNVAMLQEMKLEVVREMTKSIVESGQLKDIVNGINAKNAGEHKKLFILVIISFLVGVLNLLKGTAMFQPVLGFVLSLIKVVL